MGPGVPGEVPDVIAAGLASLTASGRPQAADSGEGA